MKKFLVFSFLLIFGQIKAQNIGINTPNPNTSLDIVGNLALRSSDLIISETFNYTLDILTAKSSNYKLKPSSMLTGNFVLAGIISGSDGQNIQLTNQTGFSMEIYNDDVNSIAANRILTGTNGTMAVYNGGTVHLIYDQTLQKWLVTSSHYSNLNYFGSDVNWVASGNNIINTNTHNVGIGTPTPDAKLHVNGTVKITDGSEGANKVLTSDANGLASWQSAANISNIKFGFDLTGYPGPGYYPYGDYNYTLNYNTDPTNILITSPTALYLVKPGIYRFGLIGMYYKGDLISAGPYPTYYKCTISVGTKDYNIIYNSPVIAEGISRVFRQQNSLTYDVYVPENSTIKVKFVVDGGPATLTTTGYFFGYFLSE